MKTIKISIKREQNNACISSAEHEKFGAKLNTKNILKTLAFAMLMPVVMLLTTACSSDDDFTSNANTANTENTAKKGYTLPVTINVSREGGESGTMSVSREGGESGTRASFNESTKQLEFSTGDKLFVYGAHENAGNYAGVLNYESGGKFSGTLTLEYSYPGTIDELLTGSHGSAIALLLPAGYESYGYLTYTEYNGYDAKVANTAANAIASTKAEALEQFSYERGTYTSGSGFALAPQNAILNFTVTGLVANADVPVVFSNSSDEFTQSVSTDESGTATFAIGVANETDLNDYTLAVGGSDITLVSASKVLSAGKIYDITRAVPPAIPLSEVTVENLGDIIGSDSKIYDSVEAATLAGVIAVAKIMYVGNDAETNTTYNHGLAIALQDVSGNKIWCTQDLLCAKDYYSEWVNAKDDVAGIDNTDHLLSYTTTHDHQAAKAARNYKYADSVSEGAHPEGTSEWFLAASGQWEKMAYSAGNYKDLGLKEANYWSSTECGALRAWSFYAPNSNGYWQPFNKINHYYSVRPCLAS